MMNVDHNFLLREITAARTSAQLFIKIPEVDLGLLSSVWTIVTRRFVPTIHGIPNMSKSVPCCVC